MNFSKEEREAYEDHLKWLRMESSAVQCAEARGEERGIQIGQAKAIEQMALSMLNRTIDPKLISSITGLSIEHLEKLIKEHSCAMT